MLWLASWLVCFSAASPAQAPADPYWQQVAEHVAGLRATEEAVRAKSAEALGFLRAYAAEPDLIAAMADPSPTVRRTAALALGWCGDRRAVGPLLDRLDDTDWNARQAAYVALTNLTGMELPFDAIVSDSQRRGQIQAWRRWWKSVPGDRPPAEVLAMLRKPQGQTSAWSLTASTTYHGPLEVLIDGQLAPGYWQTKAVKPPQWCQIDFGRPIELHEVTVHQYASGYCMTEYELSISLDGKRFDRVERRKGVTPVELVIRFQPRKAQFVRITSFGSQRAIYPTTFREIEINGRKAAASDDRAVWQQERGARALGSLAGRGGSAALIDLLGANPPSVPKLRPMIRAAVRSLGRLRDEAGFQYLIALLDNPMWARNAADALGDFGDRRAVPSLLQAYARYAKRLDEKYPPDVPADDNMKFPSEDRMLETAYWIAYALCRLPLDDPETRQSLRRLSPLVMANLPGDHDTYMLYEPEVGHRLTRYLLDKAGMRQEAAEQALRRLGQARRAANPEPDLVWSPFVARRVSAWLPCVCTEKADVPRLLALLEDPNGWVRLNAAKALAWLGDPRAVEPIAAILRSAKAEADYGQSTTFKDDEFNDPCPRWREGLVRALGLLKARGHVGLLAKIMNDERSAMEIRHAAAEALADVASPEALAELRKAAVAHPIHTVQQVARDALWVRGVTLETPTLNSAEPRAPQAVASSAQLYTPANVDALLFIKGPNNLPNSLGTVEQCDRWRQTYVVTDEGPSYRPGFNLYVLSPMRPDGRVTPVTRFDGGYVAEPELSWDARQVLFTRREPDSLWWHVWRVNVDGSGLAQLTSGPYHDIGPRFLPDGRIVLATSRSGVRDEYHGYPCTALYVMNADGSDLHPIATNIGRDNEPALLPDGRLLFSRLEVFYSRNKTELLLHAMFPDGTRDTVLYGPERRKFWRELDHGAPDPADGQEAPLTHRVLRMTQAEPMPDGRNIIASTQAGLALIGSRRDTEQLISPDFKNRAYTTPWPLADGTILCGSTLKTPDRNKVDLGLYRLHPDTGQLDLIYNDPQTADYEPRPIVPRRPPPVRPEIVKREAYSGRFFCASVFNTIEPDVAERGRLVRLVEGVPVIARHATHTGPEPVWKNHGGTLARVLGMAPLAPDGSFYVELPADRLVHLQVLDSDRRVIGNQTIWTYVRPGETKSCAGCHENRHATPPSNDPLASHFPPLDFRPTGREFSYRAKAWFKGSLPAEIEERTRTVHAVNLLGRP